MQMKKFIVFAVLAFNSAVILAQNGIVSGQIKDKTTGETLPGVKVTLENQLKGALSDLDGFYTLGNIPFGKHNLNFNFNGYQTVHITDLEVGSLDTIKLDIVLEPLIKEIVGVSIKAKINRETQATVVQMQQKSASVMDGISQEAIKKSPDSKASDVLKRVSGASVQDNKFVVIRGLSDRYNFALINGASLPSSESDRKAFSFDIFPSNMLDNLVIMKTATPDLPGEFAGGVLDINTIEPKDKLIHNIQLGGGFNTLSTFQNFATSQSGKMDWLGLGASSRSIPTGIPATADFSSLTKDMKAGLADKMNFNWSPNSRKGLPNGSLQYTLGNTFKLNEKSLGVVFAYNYSNTWTMSELSRREFEEQAAGVVKKMELKDSVFTVSILNSALLNTTFKFNEKNKISLKSMYSISSDDRINKRKGVRELDNDPHQWEKSTNFWFTQNNLFTTQLIGNHTIGKGKLNWTGGFSDVSRQIPNLRRVVYKKLALDENNTDVNLGDTAYAAVIQANGTIPTAAGNMFWSNSNEKIYSGKYDYSIHFGKDSANNLIKIGGLHQFRSREFEARNFGFSQYKPTGSSFNSSLLLLDANQIFSSENLGLLANGQGGFKLDEASNVDDSYQASSTLHAGFGMIDTKLSKDLRFVGGVRFESYNQVFNYIEFGTNKPKHIDTTVNDFLPSANLIYALNDKFNIRSSFYRTVSRPEFRELAPFSFYNFVQDNIVSGNPNLQRATINNYDLRLEWFPGAGQIISVSGFYKEFFNPIETINRTGTSGAPELYYANVDSARVYNIGGEFEFRMKLASFMKNKENPFFNNLTLYNNLSIIRSSVDLSAFAGSGGIRPLQGQSPFIVNSGLIYTDPKKDWSVSASYNIVGPRIYIVGNVQEPSVWENSRNVIDFQLAKTFNEKVEIKLNVRDILAQQLTFFQDLNGNRKFDPETDNNWQTNTFGQTISLSVKYIFHK
jgi:outer membrane receptor protein involved in Fe transport